MWIIHRLWTIYIFPDSSSSLGRQVGIALKASQIIRGKYAFGSRIAMIVVAEPSQWVRHDFAAGLIRIMEGKHTSHHLQTACTTAPSHSPTDDQNCALWVASHLYFDSVSKAALTGIKTDRTICEYDINSLQQLNPNHYILIDQLKSRRDKKKRRSNQWRRLYEKIRNIYARS